MILVNLDCGLIGLGGLLALGPRDRLDGAERSVEPGLLGSLNLVECQTQVVLQVLMKKGNTHYPVKSTDKSYFIFQQYINIFSSCPIRALFTVTVLQPDNIDIFKSATPLTNRYDSNNGDNMSPVIQLLIKG